MGHTPFKNDSEEEKTRIAQIKGYGSPLFATHSHPIAIVLHTILSSLFRRYCTLHNVHTTYTHTQCIVYAALISAFGHIATTHILLSENNVYNVRLRRHATSIEFEIGEKSACRLVCVCVRVCRCLTRLLRYCDCVSCVARAQFDNESKLFRSLLLLFSEWFKRRIFSLLRWIGVLNFIAFHLTDVSIDDNGAVWAVRYRRLGIKSLSFSVSSNRLQIHDRERDRMKTQRKTDKE